MFSLSPQEVARLKSQFVISNVELHDATTEARSAGLQPARPSADARLTNVFTKARELLRYAAAVTPPRIRRVEVSEGVVIDYDARGNLVGIDIDNASTKVDMRILQLVNLTTKVETVAA